MIADGFDLDHVALAATDVAPALQFLTGRLGGTVLFGGHAIGFRPMQVLVGDKSGGMKIELLEPWAVERNDFLARFLVRHRHGPHHLTFKVPDLEHAIERCRTAGYRPVNIDRSDPHWKECFLLPKEANGTVVQLAQAAREFPDRAALLDHVRAHGPDCSPQWWVDPPPAEGAVSFLRCVVLRTPSITAALALFGGLLDGAVTRDEPDRADLTWPGGAVLAFELHAQGPPGIDRLEIEGLEAEVSFIGTRFVPAGSRSEDRHAGS